MVFTLDVLAGAQVSPWGLYLLPVLIAGWLFGGSAALNVGAFSSALIVLAALLAGHPFDTWGEFFVSWCSRTASLMVVAWLAGLTRRGAVAEGIERARQGDYPL